MNFTFHPEAESEFNDSIEYYKDIEPILGFDFATEIYSSIKLIISFPKAWPEIDSGIHRILIKRFPYGVLYSLDHDEIYILAVMHLHRDPDYWKHRIG